MAELCVQEVNTNSTEDLDCIVCWEPIPTTLPVELACGHEACRPCIQSWIERCEKEGHDNATCPHCRQVLDTESILGRPFQTHAQTATATDDSFTQVWLQDHDAHQCSNCGVWMVQEEDEIGEGVATACVCGYIYCWTCKGGAEGCECDHCEFYDQLTDTTLCMSVADRFPVAGPEQFEESLSDFMEKRKEAIHKYERGDEEEDEDDEEELQEEPAEADLLPLFWDCKTEVQEETALANPVPPSGGHVTGMPDAQVC